MGNKKSRNSRTAALADKMLVCDFLKGSVNYRQRFGGGRGQHLARAVGFKPGLNPLVVDATAGLGRDAFHLASLGAKVTLIERSHHIFELLRTGLDLARDAGGVASEIVGRMTLVKGDSIELLPTLTPEIILVDPMHPPRRKSALVKSEMRQIRAIVGVDEDQIELMRVALASASKRVVLKWPAKAPMMSGIEPYTHQIIGKSVRYDVFVK